MSQSGVVLFDPHWRKQLLPLAFTRSIAEFRVGILTIRDKWRYLTGDLPFLLTEPYLQPKYPINATSNLIYVNAALLPDQLIWEEIDHLDKDRVLLNAIGDVLAVKLSNNVSDLEELSKIVQNLSPVSSRFDTEMIRYCWDIFTLNGAQIRKDIQLMGLQPSADRLSATNRLVGHQNIYVEEGVKAEFAIINASAGPVYLGKESEVMEGVTIRAPFALGDHSQVKMGAKIYGDTTIGPYCKVGGEITNSVIFGYSNKAHDGFLGNSVVGEWCNLGADTNNSNLKNNYSKVSAYSYLAKKMVDTHLQFCGLIMGDHSKCGINTMFNTGTVVGISANIFGGGFPPKYIPSFSWGGSDGLDVFLLDKALEVAQSVMKRRSVSFLDIDQRILQHIFSITSADREKSGEKADA